ncbi:MAG: phosphoglycerate dehydrogenase [Leptospiraceae bacterium]|nr:phosphoglycerate dehydrogenase [Leptospiraceae bacterium]MCP5495127.1 phosphoglycerate dehydrogenase [Leptospiraceae bacterium]
MYKIQTLNNISVVGLETFPRDKYEIASEIQNPDAILLRSFKMHDYPISPSLKAVGRAGAGVNNIPVDKLSQIGVPVFNTPGANANAVKELVLAGMFLAARNICQGWDYARNLQGSDEEVSKQTESGKSKFAGFELPGRTLGVIGLGAIGVKVANAALSLGMKVIGYDPVITVKNAWEVASDVQQAVSLDDMLSKVDMVTFHVPLNDKTKNMLDANRINLMKKGVVILNFARGGIVNDEAVCQAIQAGKVKGYVCDFPTNLLKNHPGVITLPHLGASTEEAEDNCAFMVSNQIRDFLENGNIVNSVNFPEVKMLRTESENRLAITNMNEPNMVAQISSDIGKNGLNILDMLNKSKGNLAYTLMDLDKEVSDEVLQNIKNIKGVLSVRRVPV